MTRADLIFCFIQITTIVTSGFTTGTIELMSLYHVIVLYCTVFSVYSNVFVLCMSVNTCKHVSVLYCNVFSVYLTLTFPRRILNPPLFKNEKAWNEGGFIKRSLR